jgi:bacillithiol synthase
MLGGRPAVNSHCFPFRQIPHSTRLFLDFLEHTPSVRPFYPRSADFLEWVNEEASRVQYPAGRRRQLSAILERQNKAFGASAETLKNIEAFRSGALAVVTGQQVGLFGGPAFSLYKALSAVKLAQEASNRGIRSVPIFWLATEDHDLAEVSDVGVPASDAQRERLAVHLLAPEDAPVGTIHFGPEIAELVSQLEGIVGPSEALTALAECYRPGESFGTAFAKFFARVFADFGVILLDGSDPELDLISSPLYEAAIRRNAELNQALLERDEQLQSAGYHQQVHITSATTPLFLMRNGSRVPLQAAAEKGIFVAGNEKITTAELLALVANMPESLSPNVLLRPVVQDYLLPTLTYIGGAAEVAYFAQAGVLHEKLLGRVTPVLPRFSATVIEAKPQALLERYQLSFSDLFHGPDVLRETIGSRLLDPGLQRSFDEASRAAERSMAAIRNALEKLDKTLVESANNAESKIQHQISSLRSRAARAELRQSEVAERHARFLSNTLYPEKTLQEREVGGVYFLTKYGRELLSGLLSQINPDCVDHQLVSL